jgi:hypothetical protein
VSDSPRPEHPGTEPSPTDVAATLIEFANASVSTDDVVGLFTLLSTRTVEVLNIAAAGVLLVTPDGTPMAIGSSSHSAHLLDLFQIQSEQGPCLTCCRTGEQVADADLANDGPWPLFARAARDWGYRAVYALPLASRGVTMGAVNLFATTALSEANIDLAQALADIATLSLIQASPLRDAEVVARSLHDAMESRIALEQAKGMLAVRFSEDADAAFSRILSASEVTGMPLGTLAASVVTRTTDAATDAALMQPQPSTTTPRQKA